MLFHNLNRAFATLLVTVTLTGCAVVDDNEHQPDMAQACQADAYKSMLWKPISVLKTSSLPANTRIIRPGQAVTMDYRPNRLNIKIGKLDRIEQVYCG